MGEEEQEAGQRPAEPRPYGASTKTPGTWKTKLMLLCCLWVFPLISTFLCSNSFVLLWTSAFLSWDKRNQEKRFCLWWGQGTTREAAPVGDGRGAIMEKQQESKAGNPRVRAEVGPLLSTWGPSLTPTQHTFLCRPWKISHQENRSQSEGEYLKDSWRRKSKPSHGEKTQWRARWRLNKQRSKQTKPRRVSTNTIKLPMCSLSCLSSNEQS